MRRQPLREYGTANSIPNDFWQRVEKSRGNTQTEPTMLQRCCDEFTVPYFRHMTRGARRRDFRIPRFSGAARTGRQSERILITNVVGELVGVVCVLEIPACGEQQMMVIGEIIKSAEIETGAVLRAGGVGRLVE